VPCVTTRRPPHSPWSTAIAAIASAPAAARGSSQAGLVAELEASKIGSRAPETRQAFFQHVKLADQHYLIGVYQKLGQFGLK
jgi:hypothetical protein